jgi:hypothetical protein
MNALQSMQLALLLLQGIVSSFKSKGIELPTEIIEDVQAAIARIQKYAGTDVTFSQLEEMKLTPQW